MERFFFPYKMLRKRFMTTLLSMLSKVIPSQEFKNELYKDYNNGFYVHTPNSHFSNVKKCYQIYH